MLLTKVKLAAAALTAVGALTWLAVGVKTLAFDNDSPEPEKARVEVPSKPEGPPEGLVALRGRVLDLAGGRPVAGAKLELTSDPIESGSSHRAARGTTDEDGRFELQVPKKSLAKGAKLIARADGFAPDWADLNLSIPRDDRAPRPNPEEFALRLPRDDVPIEGRIVDLEGQPVGNVKIELNAIFKPEDGGLEPYFQKVKKENLYWGGADFGLLKHASAQDLGLPPSVTTDDQGRFRLDGIGRDRVVHLITRGAAFEHDYERFVTRTDGKGLPESIHPAKFVLHASPSKPIVGTVTEKKTGKPARGVVLSMDGHQKTTTDEQGRFRLDGIAKRKQYSLWAQGAPYFTILKMDIADTPGFEPLTVNLEMERGVAIRGRLFDQDTGQPVKGQVEFLSYSHNPHLKDYTLVNSNDGIYRGASTRDDGSFTVIGIPGPGLLVVRAQEGRYLPADTKAVDALPKTEYGWPLTAPPANPGEYNAMVPVEEDSKATVHEIGLRTGRSLEVELVDPDGKPVVGAHVAGRESKRQMMGPIPGKDSRKLAGSTLTAVGLDSGHARYLVIVHPERKLGKLQAVRGNEPAPLKVTLEPLGAFKGRVVDFKGKPVGGLEVRAAAPRELSRYWKDDPSLPEEVMFGFDRPGTLPERFSGQATTADDGTFQIDGLVPGFPYVVDIYQPGQRNFLAEHFFKGVATESGATKDLGDLKVRMEPGQ